ncbi:hypothetical protein BZA05DRAFT_444896 [Tricharina praecox]|uniref:uncharacterized protein n=1 Tax=Tricharina praecox TaxID=43433 RepID=UPI002220670B|nr:uncharacterized protein BZA05DRAFT_444896 [Tricharina praecox]KAI5852363.1 hypothetical protein BZA05DRAFT_444896 [Tricharina praecox]
MPARCDASGAERFLYMILSQVDTTKLDWNLIAAENNISTAAAARLRWTRYKAAMNPAGTTTPAATTPKKTPKKTPVKRKGSDEGSVSPTPASKKRVRKPKPKPVVEEEEGEEEGEDFMAEKVKAKEVVAEDGDE